VDALVKWVQGDGLGIPMLHPSGTHQAMAATTPTAETQRILDTPIETLIEDKRVEAAIAAAESNTQGCVEAPQPLRLEDGQPPNPNPIKSREWAPEAQTEATKYAFQLLNETLVQKKTCRTVEYAWSIKLYNEYWKHCMNLWDELSKGTFNPKAKRQDLTVLEGRMKGYLMNERIEWSHLDVLKESIDRQVARAIQAENARKQETTPDEDTNATETHNAAMR
jgi:hypothetical protein